MPDNQNKWSIDYYVYQFIYKYSPYINPNLITTFNTLLITPIIYLLYYRININIFIILNINRTILDIADGAIARKYNMCSDFGKYFDFISDMIYWMCIFITTYYKTRWDFIIGLIIYEIYLSYEYIFRNRDIFNDNIISKIIHDNTIISVPSITYYFFYLK